ncbi:mcl1, partial [Symbiodinium pilosum]
MTSTQWGSKTVCVRINPMDTPLWEADVTSTLKLEKPDMLVVPKVSSPADLDKLAAKLA